MEHIKSESLFRSRQGIETPSIEHNISLHNPPPHWKTPNPPTLQSNSQQFETNQKNQNFRQFLSSQHLQEGIGYQAETLNRLQSSGENSENLIPLIKNFSRHTDFPGQKLTVQGDTQNTKDFLLQRFRFQGQKNHAPQNLKAASHSHDMTKSIADHLPQIEPNNGSSDLNHIVHLYDPSQTSESLPQGLKKQTTFQSQHINKKQKWMFNQPERTVQPKQIDVQVSVSDSSGDHINESFTDQKQEIETLSKDGDYTGQRSRSSYLTFFMSVKDEKVREMSSKRIQEEAEEKEEDKFLKTNNRKRKLTKSKRTVSSRGTGWAESVSVNRQMAKQPFNRRPVYQQTLDRIGVSLYDQRVFRLKQSIKLNASENFKVAVNEYNTLLDKVMRKDTRKTKRIIIHKPVNPKYRVKKIELSKETKIHNIEIISNFEVEQKTKESKEKITAKKYVDVVRQDNRIYNDLQIQASDLSSESEQYSDEDWQFNVSKSRQAIVRPFIKNIMRKVLRHQRELDTEEVKLMEEEEFSLAIHYINKVEHRINRMIQGESIGSMIDSEFENLEIDESYERIRRKIEVPSSDEDQPEVQLKELTSVADFEASRQKDKKVTQMKGVQLRKEQSIIIEVKEENEYTKQSIIMQHSHLKSFEISSEDNSKLTGRPFVLKNDWKLDGQAQIYQFEILPSPKGQNPYMATPIISDLLSMHSSFKGNQPEVNYMSNMSSTKKYPTQISKPISSDVRTSNLNEDLICELKYLSAQNTTDGDQIQILGGEDIVMSEYDNNATSDGPVRAVQRPTIKSQSMEKLQNIKSEPIISLLIEEGEEPTQTVYVSVQEQEAVQFTKNPTSTNVQSYIHHMRSKQNLVKDSDTSQETRNLNKHDQRLSQNMIDFMGQQPLLRQDQSGTKSFQHETMLTLDKAATPHLAEGFTSMKHLNTSWSNRIISNSFRRPHLASEEFPNEKTRIQSTDNIRKRPAGEIMNALQVRTTDEFQPRINCYNVVEEETQPLCLSQQDVLSRCISMDINNIESRVETDKSCSECYPMEENTAYKTKFDKFELPKMSKILEMAQVPVLARRTSMQSSSYSRRGSKISRNSVNSKNSRNSKGRQAIKSVSRSDNQSFFKRQSEQSYKLNKEQKYKEQPQIDNIFMMSNFKKESTPCEEYDYPFQIVSDQVIVADSQPQTPSRTSKLNSVNPSQVQNTLKQESVKVLTPSNQEVDQSENQNQVQLAKQMQTKYKQAMNIVYE